MRNRTPNYGVGWGGADGTYRAINNQHAPTLGEEGPRSVGCGRASKISGKSSVKGHPRQTKYGKHPQQPRACSFFALGALKALDKASIKALTMQHHNDLFTSLQLPQD